MKIKKMLLVLVIAISLFISIDSVFAYVLDSNITTYQNYDTETISCGNGIINDLPKAVPKIISIVYISIQFAVPIVLVIFGMLDLFKGITAQKEDEIKKGQQMLVKRLIYAALIFFIIVIVKLFISIIADSTTNGNIVECIDCFLVDKEKCKK